MIDLTKFCSTNGTRYHIQKPWSRGGYSYATDGHILIRVPRLSNIEENPEAPAAEKLCADALARTDYQWIKPPKVQIAVFDCELCNGEGKLDEDHREAICDYCNGTGKETKAEAIHFTVGDKEVGLSNIYLALIGELPKAEIGLTEAAAVTWRTHSKNELAVMFRFDGGIGLLMPMRI